MVLLQELWVHLHAGDVLLADRGFSSWGSLAQCQLRGIHAVFRVRGKLRGSFRYGRRLSANQRLVEWIKPRTAAKSISAKEWAQLPEKLSLRLVRCQVHAKGYRTRQVTVVTTLLDPVKYPPCALAELYLRRWNAELSLRDLKTTLQMEHLSCTRPDYVDRELRMHFLIHNLVRRVMLEAARVHNVALCRVSFAGALAGCRRFGEALLQARSKRVRQELVTELLCLLALDQVPLRPGRREPRAVKRRPKPYPRLTKHRSVYVEIPHKSSYWSRKSARAS